MELLHKGPFVNAMDAELKRRGYFRATGSISGAIEWRRSVARRHRTLGLRVEIRPLELRFTFPDGRRQIDTVKDLAEACFLIDAAELTAEFGSD
jgi:hypothetical protein